MTVAFLLVSLLGIGSGGLAHLLGHGSAADVAFAATAAASLAMASWSMIRSLMRGAGGVDVIAVAAIAGAVLLGEYLAGAVIGLMLATGRALEDYASRRAERELSDLLSRAPRVANRVEGSEVLTVPVDEVAIGDTILVREGDVVPVDGFLSEGGAVLDESALTGEARLVERGPGEHVRSGATNAGPSFRLRCSAVAAESTYAGIIRMVREAQESKAPLVRVADRYARYFVPLAFTVSASAGLIAGDPTRALAVLVVATPCPLLLAAPVAIVSGMSRMARRGVVVKGGAALEVLARGRAIYLDKTGTLTAGAPRLQTIARFEGGERSVEEILRLAASLNQVSSHVLAEALVGVARERGLALSFPTDALEDAGAGVAGRVDGAEVRLGTLEWAVGGRSPLPAEQRFRRRLMREEGSVVFVALDGQLAGAFVFDDPVRPDAPRVVRLLKRLGFEETVMLTGDHLTVAESVGTAIGVDRVLSDLTPGEKVEAVAKAKETRVTVMVGDGINDAPALAAADVGVAMGARGATSSSEAADVVLLVDRLDRLVEAVEIARHARRVAVQSVLAGMVLSLVAMGAAAAGYLPPVAGAIVQEGIDAAAILNALRALRGGRRMRSVRVPLEMAEPLRAEHRELVPRVEELRELADRLDDLPGPRIRPELDRASSTVAVVVAHEVEDEQRVYRALAEHLDGDDPMAAMSRTHQEIFHLARAFDRMVAEVPAEGPDAAELVDIRRTLYALHAVLRLNIAQEEELYLALAPDREVGIPR